MPSRSSLLVALLATLALVGCRLPRPAVPDSPADSAHVRSSATATAKPSPTVTPTPVAAGHPEAPRFPRLASRESLVLVAVAGWLTAMASIFILVRQNQQWRTSFRTREWYLVPSQHGDALLSAADRIIQAQKWSTGVLQQSLGAVSTATSAHTEAIERTRSEFGILRDELADKRAALEAARLGTEFRARRPALVAMARAADIIREDLERGRDASSTLQGLRAELEDCLHDHSIMVRYPAIGQQVAADPAIDLASVVRVPAPEESLRGTVHAVDRPAYVIRAADGQEEVLLPARVRVCV